MSSRPAPKPAPVDNVSFAFVQDLASELNRGKVDMPSFPDIALRVRQVLADDAVRPEQVVRVVSAEPALAAQLLRIANSAALNVTRKQITDLRTAVTRLGFNMVRTAAISFAMSQLKKAESLKGLDKLLDELWRRSAAVASMTYVLAKRRSTVNPDLALLAGLLHGIGQLYILTRASHHPGPVLRPGELSGDRRDWSAPVAKALLENWGMAEEIILAVSEYEDHDRRNGAPPDLVDVLCAGYQMAIFKEWPDSLELNLQNVAACRRLSLNEAACRTLIEESEEELTAMRQALGV